MEKNKRYTIGEISKITGLSITTLRFYDKKGLFKPEIRDKYTNYRYYSSEQILVGALIYEYRAVGYSIESMKSILSNLNVESMLKAQVQCLNMLEEEIKIRQRQIHRIKNICGQTISAIQDFRPNLPLKDQVVFSSYPSKTVVFSRRQSELVSEGLWWDRYLELLQIRDREGLTICGPFTALFHMPYSERFSLIPGDLELFFPICDRVIEHDNIRCTKETMTASLVVQGGHRSLYSEYTKLMDIIAKNGYSVCGPPMEEYLIELVQTRNPEEYITRIHLPVEKIKNPHSQLKIPRPDSV